MIIGDNPLRHHTQRVLGSFARLEWKHNRRHAVDSTNAMSTGKIFRSGFQRLAETLKATLGTKSGHVLVPNHNRPDSMAHEAYYNGKSFRLQLYIDRSELPSINLGSICLFPQTVPACFSDFNLSSLAHVHHSCFVCFKTHMRRPDFEHNKIATFSQDPCC